MQAKNLQQLLMGAVGELSDSEKEDLKSVIQKLLEDKIDTDSYLYYRKVLAKYLKAGYYLDLKQVSNNEINRWIPGIRIITKEIKALKQAEQQKYLDEIEETNRRFQETIN
ncbi:MAG: hypothetical protein UT48_C0002G0015 [Parcubacteria group bacterium GW2011_GWE2_39_37]|uniref:Uncharacterized protein n=1 Tax=Candidatus Falkowbacteria bacterium GW2011_GWF2_39_8 TaxID=1618642 RepID=A0A0G0T2F7_9BACT|nr:MAG: hypothetical protein UT48_C0002G0015 [Parcubacteria group bacterium GW2011_GWE2_39_37]KKR32027.1 MAG: hypothetical protein UT64_C0044G0004 [Candidatus Falkowbacteria bacterium GW2011_GWF2_39_8]